MLINIYICYMVFSYFFFQTYSSKLKVHKHCPRMIFRSQKEQSFPFVTGLICMLPTSPQFLKFRNTKAQISQTGTRRYTITYTGGCVFSGNNCSRRQPWDFFFFFLTTSFIRCSRLGTFFRFWIFKSLNMTELWFDSQHEAFLEFLLQTSLYLFSFLFHLVIILFIVIYLSLCVTQPDTLTDTGAAACESSQ